MRYRLIPEPVILIAVFLISILGLLSITSSTNQPQDEFRADLVTKQLSWFCLGIIIFALVMNFNYHRFQDFAWMFYILSILLLILVLSVAEARGGAQRWLQIWGVNFQPSEFARFAVILVLAKHLSQRKLYTYSRANVLGLDLEIFQDLILPVLIVSLPMFLINLQPHLGAAISFLPILFFMLFFAGIRIRYLLFLAVSGLLSLPLFWHFLKQYQKERLLVFLNPNLDPLGAGYTITQSKIAIGSGGFTGKGWLAGTQSQLNFLPERHTDFIFSVVGEEWGFLGALVLIILYCFIIMRAIKICSATNDTFAQLVLIGIISALTFQVVVNIAMTLGVMPVVGITLPLMSYGGTSVLMTFIFLGIILNISKRKIVF